MDNIKRNDRKDSTEKYWEKKVSVKNTGEGIENEMAVEIRNIETKAKPQEINEVASGVSNNL